MGNEQSSGAGADDLRLHNVPIKLPTGESKLTCQFSIFPFQSGPNFTLVSISFQHYMSRFWVLGSISRWYHISSELFLPLKFKMWTKIWVGPRFLGNPFLCVALVWYLSVHYFSDGNIPNKEELEARFQNVLASANVSSESAGFLHNYTGQRTRTSQWKWQKILDEQKWKLICDHDGATVKASPAEFVERLKVILEIGSFSYFFRMLSTCQTTKNTRKIVTLLFNCCES